MHIAAVSDSGRSNCFHAANSGSPVNSPGCHSSRFQAADWRTIAFNALEPGVAASECSGIHFAGQSECKGVCFVCKASRRFCLKSSSFCVSVSHIVRLLNTPFQDLAPGLISPTDFLRVTCTRFLHEYTHRIPGIYL